MSNHSGSYLLQNALEIMEELGFFKNVTIEQIRDLCQKLSVMASCEYDCNPGEIMETMSKKYGICYCCWELITKSEADKDFNGMCKKCYDE